jgi:hypothetical protein
MSKSIFFFTAEEPREIPKGSRDPLRFLPEWTKVARKMIPYLTTVTPSYRGFLTRFLFHGLLEDIVPALANASADEQWVAFCKFEQLCAFVRTNIEPFTPNLPGISGVSGRVKGCKVVLGSDTAYWLVRSQKNTGYWGYYHQACLGSGLIRKNKTSEPGYQLTDEALVMYRESDARSRLMNFKEVFLRIFKEKELQVDINELAPLAELFAQRPISIGGAWSSFWVEHLLIPRNETSNSFAQSEFAKEVQNVLHETPSLSVGQIWERLSLSTTSEIVSSFAKEVMASEAVIGLCEWVFDVCRMKNVVTMNDAAQWAYNNGYDDNCLERLRKLQQPSSTELALLREVALNKSNSFKELAHLLLERHKKVMTGRKGVPAWVELHHDVLHIRDYSDEPSKPDDLKNSSVGIRWRYDYFLSSWLGVAKEIGYLQDRTNG